MLKIVVWQLFVSLLVQLDHPTVLGQGYSRKKPNIIIILADDLGWNDVGFHNPAIISPNLNRLAEKGVELSRLYVASICSPTRAGLLTGKYPDRFGLRTDVIRPTRVGGLPLTEKTIADVLGQAGYTHRGAFGKWHLGHSDSRYHPLNRGFTTFYGHYNGALDYFSHIREGQLDWHRDFQPNRDTGYTVDLVAKEASRFIATSAKKNEPFFAYIAFNGVHAPLQAKLTDLLTNGYEGSKGTFGKGNPVEKSGRGNTPRQTYKAMVTGLDSAIGQILAEVDKAGISDNTLIWFLSDNGGAPAFGGSNEPLRGKKNTEWEGGVRSASLVYWKGYIEGGKKTEEVISFVDVLPTLAEVAGLKYNKELDGENVWHAFKGEKLKQRTLFLGREAVVEGNWKLNEKQLFNLATDPSEINDLAISNPTEYKRLVDALLEFKKFVQPFSLANQPEGWKPPVNWTMPKYYRP